MYLGVKAVIAKSFERIHATNLVNFGIMPLAVRGTRRITTKSNRETPWKFRACVRS